MPHDIVILGGGPAGLAAALMLGRARRRVALVDGGPRRNATAAHLHNFITRDGTPPSEFRELGRADLARYPNVTCHDVGATRVDGSKGRFEVTLANGERLEARRVLVTTGMIDEPLPLEGAVPLWGHSIFICPYCHAWEFRGRRFAVWASGPEIVDFALHLQSWSRDVTLLLDQRFELADDVVARLTRGGVEIDPRRITRLEGRDGQIERVHFAEGAPRAVDALFARPRQRPTPIVEQLARDLGLTLDPSGFVALDEQRRTNVPGLYAGGDLLTPAQGAVFAAASAMQAAAMLNHELIHELASSGELELHG